MKTKDIVRLLLVIVGTICVGLGILGIFMPMLPTAPFLVLASICYARGSERCHRWLTTNRWFGKQINNYQEGRGVTLKYKLYTILLLWLTIGYTALYVVSQFWAKLLLVSIAVGVSIHLMWIKTAE